MKFFQTDRVMARLDRMMDNAIAGRPIENGFDETKMSALETKLSQYLAMNSATKTQLAEEKTRIHELISDISHQTKTPIANLLLYAQILEESDLRPREKECARALVEQSEKLGFLIASLVKASRLETGIITVSPAPGALAPMLGKAVAEALPKAERKGIRIICQETESHAIFDSKWTGEALANLLDNAIKYTPQGGEVSLSVTDYPLFCRIDCTDTGIGISEEETAKIFARFYRSPAVSEVEGVGIGLYLTREIIAAQGGYLKVRSTPQRGSTFSVFLPREV